MSAARSLDSISFIALLCLIRNVYFCPHGEIDDAFFDTIYTRARAPGESDAVILMAKLND